jgi:hypothetical protein
MDRNRCFSHRGAQPPYNIINPHLSIHVHDVPVSFRHSKPSNHLTAFHISLSCSLIRIVNSPPALLRISLKPMTLVMPGIRGIGLSITWTGNHADDARVEAIGP